MKCANCNGINVEGTRFCMYCGTEMMQPQQMNYGGQPQQQMYQQMPQQRVKLQPYNRPAKRQLSPVERKKRNKIIAIASGAATFVMLMVLIIALVNRSVDVKDYVKISYTGKNGKGKATATIDYGKFTTDYTGKISYTDEYKAEREKLRSQLGMLGGKSLNDEMAAYDFIRNYVTVSCKNNKNLSNGDTIKVVIKIDENAYERFDIDVENEVFEVTVDGVGKKNSKKSNSTEYDNLKKLNKYKDELSSFGW